MVDGLLLVNPAGIPPSLTGTGVQNNFITDSVRQLYVANIG
jgi:hypothetical protein